MRRTKTIEIKHIEPFKAQLIQWGDKHTESIWLDSNAHQLNYGNFDCILAVDAQSHIESTFTNAFDKLQQYQNNTSDWIFGYLSYDLKNDLEQLKSQNFDGLEFPDLFFFQPKKIFFLKNNSVTISYLETIANTMDLDLKDIQNAKTIGNQQTNKLNIQSRLTKQKYLAQVTTLQKYIQRGDVYEANFCQELFAFGKIKPLQTFQKLQNISLSPFAVYLKHNQKYLMSASPERFLKKEGENIISQPIKGTAKRSFSHPEDELLKYNLQSDPKERSENVMIVDLVRNDLSRVAQKGSVEVEDLCKIYSFKQVHHLISTVKAKLKTGTSPIEAIKATFPMGSMTGAPKVSAMKIIEELESTKRGLYSGAVGYFTPQGDFDFNVVIRSILYNATRSYISFSVGSAITAKSDPSKEYEECLVKAKAMRDVLEN